MSITREFKFSGTRIFRKSTRELLEQVRQQEAMLLDQTKGSYEIDEISAILQTCWVSPADGGPSGPVGPGPTVPVPVVHAPPLVVPVVPAAAPEPMPVSVPYHMAAVPAVPAGSYNSGVNAVQPAAMEVTPMSPTSGSPRPSLLSRRNASHDYGGGLQIDTLGPPLQLQTMQTVQPVQPQPWGTLAPNGFGGCGGPNNMGYPGNSFQPQPGMQMQMQMHMQPGLPAAVMHPKISPVTTQVSLRSANSLARAIKEQGNVVDVVRELCLTFNSTHHIIRIDAMTDL
jgi:hypothetical protein